MDYLELFLVCFFQMKWNRMKTKTILLLEIRAIFIQSTRWLNSPQSTTKVKKIKEKKKYFLFIKIFYSVNFKKKNLMM
jgi:hypothetical protein